MLGSIKTHVLNKVGNSAFLVAFGNRTNLYGKTQGYSVFRIGIFKNIVCHSIIKLTGKNIGIKLEFSFCFCCLVRSTACKKYKGKGQDYEGFKLFHNISPFYGLPYVIASRRRSNPLIQNNINLLFVQ